MTDAPHLPKLGGSPFLVDGGLETCLIFHDGYELPSFASFTLLDSERGRRGLATYYRRFLDIAAHHGTGFVLDAPTWRASPEWGEKLGYDRARLGEANRAAVALLRGLRDEQSATGPIAVNAAIGPRGDGYDPGTTMTADEARDYHRWQLEVAAAAGADMATALTMTHHGEAEGIAAAAGEIGLPVAVSFTVETDGRLPTGMPLSEAVGRIDDRHGAAVCFYMINCAHPSHFAHVLDGDSALASRIGGIRANASRMSHAELDKAEELDDGDPVELADDYRSLIQTLPNLCLLGGCCGTDHRHIAAIADACVSALAARAAA
ncbi:MAG: homocysteine S-methyltransferase family protein [Novosphingobium sp.]|nr:homocysteine S-methyltransferase family protein [Novosphingobium sp.]